MVHRHPGLGGIVITRIRRGRSPNCSATGSVVGLALVSLATGAGIINAFADRFTRWRDQEDPPDADREQGSRVRVRQEADHTIVAWPSPPSLLSVDEPLPPNHPPHPQPGIPGALTAPTEVHLAVTGRCPVQCEDCYLSAGPDGPEPPMSKLRDVIDELAAQGVFEVAFGGGEGLLRDGVVDLARYARSIGVIPNITTSGFGVTPEVAQQVAATFGQVNVSLDGFGTTYKALRGWDGTTVALKAIEQLTSAGTPVGVNTVLSQHNVDELEQIAARLAALGVVEWQWLRLKPSGRATEGYTSLRLTAPQAASLWSRGLAIEEETGLTLRFDCAMVPFLAMHDLDPEHLNRMGIEGCPGGISLLTRTADGQWAPCSFASGTADGPLREHWRDDPTLQQWRQRAQTPPEPCASCPARQVCRGGCRVVAEHLTGDAMAPDPECPRVCT